MNVPVSFGMPSAVSKLDRSTERIACPPSQKDALTGQKYVPDARLQATPRSTHRSGADLKSPRPRRSGHAWPTISIASREHCPIHRTHLSTRLQLLHDGVSDFRFDRQLSRFGTTLVQKPRCLLLIPSRQPSHPVQAHSNEIQELDNRVETVCFPVVLLAQSLHRFCPPDRAIRP